MNHKIISSVLIGFVALAACTQTPNKQLDTINNLSVGVVGVANLGIGSDSNAGQIRPAAALADSAVTFILTRTSAMSAIPIILLLQLFKSLLTKPLTT